MKRRIYFVLTTATVAYLSVCAAMFAMQRSLIYLPQPRKVTAQASTMRLPVPGAEIVVTTRPHGGQKA